jgi:hypothetical protein
LRAKYSLQPITQREAFAFIAEHHRHHDEPEGWLFGVAVNDGERVVGVAVVGRPVARMLQNGFTAEVTRVCIVEDLEAVTDRRGNEHAAPVASMLYSSAWRAARALGYRRLITYTLESESGTSIKAAGWREVGKAGGGQWTRPSRPRVETRNPEQKTLWEQTLEVAQSADTPSRSESPESLTAGLDHTQESALTA